MNENLTTIHHIFALLESTWKGEGRGSYPTIRSFDYRETFIFTRYDGETEWLNSHWQYGFIRILENDGLDLMNVQVGRTEVMTGSVELVDDVFRIHFVSQEIMGDPRMVASARTFKLKGDTLSYKMEMQTTKVNQMTQHLKITLQRVK